MTSKLLQLPNGDWLDPVKVSHVRYLGGDEYGPRVAIDCFNNCREHTAIHLVEFCSEAEAIQFRDDLASKCNTFR